MAIRTPVLLLTDLDQLACPLVLKANWLKKTHAPATLVFRVAVRQIESWLLADHVAMNRLFKKQISKLPRSPDVLVNPKQTLLQLAKLAPKAIRDDLLVSRGAIASQGLGYNHRLTRFVRELWDPSRAASLSPSLHRALAGISKIQ